MNADTGLPLPQRYWAIVCVALGITLAVLDGAIANVALPTIARDLHASDAASIWIVNAYQLAVTITLLPLASLGERIGYRRIYIAGLALFPMFALSVYTSTASFTSQMLAFVALPFWLQHSLGFSQVETGLYMTPWPLVIVFAAPLAGVLSDRYSAGILGGIGLALFAAGLLSLATIGAHPGTVDIVWRMALCGAGFGLFQSP
ncbi:MFS transporter, partial [Burkholderia cenocepacia]|nr:MFS transporter [Burkholderia cenocepacia]